MESLIGSITLDDGLRRRAELERDEAVRLGWEEVHWRPASAAREGADGDGRAGGSSGSAGRGASEATARKRRKAQLNVRGDGEASSTRSKEHKFAGVCPSRMANVTTTDKTLRQIIDEAMQLLDDIAHDADVAFEETHGGATKVRDMTNPGRFGNGYSAEAKRISLGRKKNSACGALRPQVPAVQGITAVPAACQRRGRAS